MFIFSQDLYFYNKGVVSSKFSMKGWQRSFYAEGLLSLSY